MLLFLLLGFTFFKHYDFIMIKCHFRPGVKETGSVPRETRPLRGSSQADPKPPLRVQSPIPSVCAGHRIDGPGVVDTAALVSESFSPGTRDERKSDGLTYEV